MIKKIVLTGGPCAGKTTILSKIEQNLCEMGYKVFIVRESATELINGGITPHKNGVGMLNFQKLILEYQYQKEEIYNNALNFINDKDIVIIYDRALLDNKAYIGDLDFNELLYELSIKFGKRIDESSILNRYDMVIHLVTSAGKKGYSLENNNARYEKEDDAILLDKRILSSWMMHDNLQVVDSYDNFDDKINKVLSLIYGCLGEINIIKKEKKYIVDFDLSLISSLNGIEFSIEQYYTDTMDKNYECRFRKVISKFGNNYYYLSQCKEGNGVTRVLVERKISEKEFDRLLQFNIISFIKKKRITFVYNNVFYKLDLYPDGLKILEICVDDRCYDECIPDCFTILEDVTNDLKYQNINYGLNCESKIKARKKQ